MERRFADIYLSMRQTNVTSNKELFQFYAGVSIAFFFFTALHTTGKYPDQITPGLINNFWNLLIIIPLNFVFLEFTIPFVAKRRRLLIYNILLGLVLLWIHVMLWSYGTYAWRSIGVGLSIYTPLKEFPSMSEALESRMEYSVGSIVFFGIIRHIYTYIRLRQAAQQLRIEKQVAELSYLKSQTNPHFLFNTLNNIYSLARDKSDLAPESILRLSKILRFMLYETGGDYISIEQELKIISDYIELEKLRYDESLTIRFIHDVEDMKQGLPPLLLMPLVENAFKHGVSETRGKPFVDVQLSVNNRQLVFIVKNSVDTIVENLTENIGLSNLRRQLELLYTDYSLVVQPTASMFTATLKVNLASHVKNKMHRS